MLSIAFECPDYIVIEEIVKGMLPLTMILEEVPGSNPRIVTAMCKDPEAFYKLGGIVAVLMLTPEIEKLKEASANLIKT